MAPSKLTPQTVTTVRTVDYHDTSAPSVERQIEHSYRLEAGDRVHVGRCSIQIERGDWEHRETLRIDDYHHELFADALLTLLQVLAADCVGDGYTVTRNREFLEQVADKLPLWILEKRAPVLAAQAQEVA